TIILPPTTGIVTISSSLWSKKSSHQPKMQPGLIAFPFFTVKYLRTTLDSNYSLYEAIKDGAGFGRQAPYLQCWKGMAGS
ncbi:hypothetical protein D6K27_25245, partial [Salmonella enterica subsp. enterica]|nr:hypothetical protein [Salmonella enterica subsp. enterica serovar Bonariensis]EBW7041093.1 hypothetical protein [Salmonella enterica subsp. enterica serovar Bonariensis]MKI01253.1 hypothetical protein [Salmonella enterica subsp. enterica serovar Bonariensis]